MHCPRHRAALSPRAPPRHPLTAIGRTRTAGGESRWSRARKREERKSRVWTSARPGNLRQPPLLAALPPGQRSDRFTGRKAGGTRRPCRPHRPPPGAWLSAPSPQPPAALEPGKALSPKLGLAVHGPRHRRCLRGRGVAWAPWLGRGPLFSRSHAHHPPRQPGQGWHWATGKQPAKRPPGQTDKPWPRFQRSLWLAASLTHGSSTLGK